jgi:hypothetical protein
MLGISAALLACVLAARVFTPGTQAGPAAFPLESVAMATGSVSSAGGVTMLTSPATNNEDILLVLDGRNETLWVYRTESNNSLTTHVRIGLPELFRQARARATGRP